MEVPQKTKNRATIWSRNPTPGHISRENHNSKTYTNPNVHHSTIYSSQIRKQPKWSINRGMDKYWAHIHHGVVLIHKKEWNNDICRSMVGPRAYHTKWSQRKTNIIWYHLLEKSKKMIQMNLFTKQKQTHRLWKQTYSYQRGSSGGTEDLLAWAGICKIW